MTAPQTRWLQQQAFIVTVLEAEVQDQVPAWLRTGEGSLPALSPSRSVFMS